MASPRRSHSLRRIRLTIRPCAVSTTLAKPAGNAYLRIMFFGRKGYFRDVSPVGAMGDLLEYWQQPTPYRWTIVAVSIAATAIVLAVFIPKSERALPEKPTITWISTFEEGRTDAEIVESNIENQQFQDRLNAELEARAERRRENYRALARASGFDPDELERQYRDDPPPADAKSITSPVAAPSPLPADD